LIAPDLARYALRENDLVIAMDGSLVGRSYAQLKAEDLPALLLGAAPVFLDTELG
jgi:type I restriction enzyme S subunit